MQKEQLIKLVNQNLTIRKISIRENSSCTNVRYWLKKYGLKTKTYNREKRNCLCCEKELTGRQTLFCGLQCQANHRQNGLVDKWKKKEIIGYSGKVMNVKPFVRRYMIEKYEYKCSKCEWNKLHPVTKLPPLEINHIDGNASNTWEENLEVLCPNCHSLTTNYKNHNKGNGKRKR